MKKKTSTLLKVTLTPKKKKNEKKFSNTKPCRLFTNFTVLINSFCLVLRVAPISLFFNFYFISLFTPFFTIYDLFTVFYLWMMLEILQILLLMSYKLVYHWLQKIISNIYSLYFLSNTSHIFTRLVCKFFSSYELIIFVYLF